MQPHAADCPFKHLSNVKEAQNSDEFVDYGAPAEEEDAAAAVELPPEARGEGMAAPEPVAAAADATAQSVVAAQAGGNRTLRPSLASCPVPLLA